ncbi:hypothetical protein CMV_008052 [Castanea mollissima]|uniref:Uncharacterized protein n=1 Tax=Castanea mollissima TaxID=60419 RepID=A0A8J4RGZ6_9ROSI|nr:hypothetical protein CMV_008052 [Castanea mollissima]
MHLQFTIETFDPLHKPPKDLIEYNNDWASLISTCSLCYTKTVLNISQYVPKGFMKIGLDDISLMFTAKFLSNLFKSSNNIALYTIFFNDFYIRVIRNNRDIVAWKRNKWGVGHTSDS